MWIYVKICDIIILFGQRRRIMSKFKDKTSQLNQQIGAMYIAMKRSDTPLYAKLACGLCVYYVLSPLDVIPDFIPVLGMVDDVVILPFLLWLAIKLMPADIMEECITQAQNDWQTDNKKRYMIPVLVIWIILFFWIFSLSKKLLFTV